MLRDLFFAASVLSASRFLLLRNRLRRCRPVPPAQALARCRCQRESIASVDGGTLDTIFVRPMGSPARAGLLVCHGIGEVVDDWLAVQVLLAEAGIASLVFDYTGYGRSPGALSVSRCAADAICCYRHLQHLLPQQAISLLGYSMGSGVAASVAAELEPPVLLLGGAFPSLRQAAQSTGVPASLAACLPDAWRTCDALRTLRMPVLLLHGEDDQLFAPSLAAELAAGAGAHCRAVTFAGCSHDAPIFEPHQDFWHAVVAALPNDATA